MLTPKQEKFCQLYVKLNNACEAYRQAYDSGGMKQQTVEKRACELLHNGKVAGRIRVIQAEMVDKLDVSPERTLQEFSRIGFSDIRKLFDVRGNLVPVKDIDSDTAAAIASFKVRINANGDEIAEIKFWPKPAALESLSKHLGLFEKDNRQKSTALAEILKEIDNGGLPAPPEC